MKTYKFISAVTFCLFFIFFTQNLTYSQSLSVFDTVNLLNSYICKNCSCDNSGNCSCDNCIYDNTTLTEKTVNALHALIQKIIQITA